MSTEFKLSGISMHNFLAFLALLGLLKTLQKSKPDWNPHTYWKDTVVYLQILPDMVTEDQVAEAVVQGLEEIGKGMKFGIKQIKEIDANNFKDLQKKYDSEQLSEMCYLR